MTNQRMKSLDNPDPNAALFTQVGMGFDSASCSISVSVISSITGFGRT